MRSKSQGISFHKNVVLAADLFILQRFDRHHKLLTVALGSRGMEGTLSVGGVLRFFDDRQTSSAPFALFIPVVGLRNVGPHPR